MAAPLMSGKYPIVLSDALRQRQASKELFTAVKCTFQPNYYCSTFCMQSEQELMLTTSLDSIKPPPTAEITSGNIKPSTSDPSQFNLSLSTNKTTTYYHGSRTDGRVEPKKGSDPKKNKARCVLIFDAANQQYVLHLLDSEFDMEHVKTTSVAFSPPSSTPAASMPSQGQTAGKSLPKNIPDEQPRAAKKAPPKRSYEKDDDDSSDGGLEIDWGGKPPPNKKKITASALASLGSAMRSGTGTPSAQSFTGSRLAGKSPYAGKTPVGYAGKSPAPYAGKSPAGYAGKSPAGMKGKSPVKYEYAGKPPAMSKPPSPDHGEQSEEEHSEEDPDEEFEDVPDHVDPGSPRGHGNARHDDSEEEDEEIDLEAEMMKEFSRMSGEDQDSESEEE